MLSSSSGGKSFPRVCYTRSSMQRYTTTTTTIITACIILVSFVAPAMANIKIPYSEIGTFTEAIRGDAPTSGSVRCQAKGTAGIAVGRHARCSYNYVGGYAHTVDCPHEEHYKPTPTPQPTPACDCSGGWSCVKPDGTCSGTGLDDGSSDQTFCESKFMSYCENGHMVLKSSSSAKINQTMVFLLGFPYTGTSALHFLLATGRGVGTLGSPGKLGSGKEGWSKVKYNGTKLKFAFHCGESDDTAGGNCNFGNIPESYIPWKLIVRKYHRLWGIKKPILLESSPPEVMHTRKLKEMFGKRNPERVKFLVLAKQPCNMPPWNPRAKMNPFGWLALLKQIVKEYKKDVFVLRYEDLCSRPQKTVAALERWLPEIGKLDINAKPLGKKEKTQERTRTKRHAHDSSLTIPEYCKQIAMPSWPLQDVIQISKADGVSGHYLEDNSSINDITSFFGYTPRFSETNYF